MLGATGISLSDRRPTAGSEWVGRGAVPIEPLGIGISPIASEPGGGQKDACPPGVRLPSLQWSPV